MRFLLLAWVLAGCTSGGADDKAPDDTDTVVVDDTEVVDDTRPTTATAACVTDNEACAPGEPGCFGDGGDMLPGANCLECHNGAARVPNWTAAGTIYADADGSEGVRGVTVRVTDSEGTTQEMTSSRSGNFYTRAALVPPLTVEIEKDGVTRSMLTPVDDGGCNACHSCDGAAGGKLYEP